jgi:acetylxylan esterase
MVYGDGTQLIGYSALNVGHTVPVHETADLAWFGITGGGSTTTSTAPPTSTSAGGTIPKWGQW